MLLLVPVDAFESGDGVIEEGEEEPVRRDICAFGSKSRVGIPHELRGKYCWSTLAALSNYSQAIVKLRGKYCWPILATLSNYSQAIVKQRGKYCWPILTALSNYSQAIFNLRGKCCLSLLTARLTIAWQQSPLRLSTVHVTHS